MRNGFFWKSGKLNRGDGCVFVMPMAADFRVNRWNGVEQELSVYKGEVGRHKRIRAVVVVKVVVLVAVKPAQPSR